MTYTAVEQDFNTALTSYNLPAGGTYNSANLGLGPLMMQNVGGSNNTNWVGPLQIGKANPFETSGFSGQYPFVITWDSVNNIDWVFLADGGTAAATRHNLLYTYNRNTGVYSYVGSILNTFPVTTNHTVRAMRATYDLTTTGTVAVSGTAVTGTSTLFSTNNCCVGNRIGFGSTNPTAISTWYYISAIGSDTGLTLTTSAGTITAGTSYVIEDLRIMNVNTNATTTNGGLFVTKGLSYQDFVNNFTVPAATTVDNIKAVYWLADASTETNTVAAGAGLEPFVNYSTQYLWVLNGTTTAQMYKYNLRAALTLTSGKDSGNSLVLVTGVTSALTGTATETNNGRAIQMASGPGSGILCFYFTTSTRVYRTVQTSTITAASTSFLADNMTMVPPGGVNTFAALATLGSMDYASNIDKLIITSSGAGNRLYATTYQTTGAQWDRIFLSNTTQLDDVSTDSSVTPVPNTVNTYCLYAQQGVLHMLGIGTSALTNILYAIPIGADWEYANQGINTGCFIILPAMNTPNCNNYLRAYTNDLQVLSGASSGDSGHNLGACMEGYKLFYRTSGISDNSGAWAQADYSNSLAGVAGASQIQFMLQFRTMGMISAPARILNIGVIYNDLSTDQHYQPSVNNSSASSGIFAWRFAVAFGTSVPTLYVRLYDAVAGTLLVTDNTASPTGTFQASTDGGSTWSAWTNADLGASTTTYIRYTPASLGSGINVRALLTLS